MRTAGCRPYRAFAVSDGGGDGFFAPLRMTGGGGGPVAHTVRRCDMTNSQKGPSGKPDGPNFAMNDSVN